jgi:hypothetical protein
MIKLWLLILMMMLPMSAWATVTANSILKVANATATCPSGSGTCPSTTNSSLTDNGTTVSTNETVSITGSGNTGIGTTSPDQALSVNGTIHSMTGGFEFPDGTTQTSANGGGGTFNTTNTTDSYTTGRVAIGTTSATPDSLKVDGSTSGSGTGDIEFFKDNIIANATIGNHFKVYKNQFSNGVGYIDTYIDGTTYGLAHIDFWPTNYLFAATNEFNLSVDAYNHVTLLKTIQSLGSTVHFKIANAQGTVWDSISDAADGVSLGVSAVADTTTNVAIPGSTVALTTSHFGLKLKHNNLDSATDAINSTALYVEEKPSAWFAAGTATNEYGIYLTMLHNAKNNYGIVLDDATVFNGLGTLTPASGLSIASNASIGTSYTSIAAPTNGLIVQGNVGIGTSSIHNTGLDIQGTGAYISMQSADGTQWKCKPANTTGVFTCS